MPTYAHPGDRLLPHLGLKDISADGWSIIHETDTGEMHILVLQARQFLRDEQGNKRLNGAGDQVLHQPVTVTITTQIRSQA